MRSNDTHIPANRKPIDNGDGTATIPLTQGKVATIDSADIDLVSGYIWYVSRYRYAAARVAGKLTYLHRHLLDAPDGKQVDHINGDGLDNRRGNLRLCTHGENLRNANAGAGNITGYKGVSRNRSKWAAKISVDGSKHHLGSFNTPSDAARAYDAAARELHGDFAFLNFPDD